MADLAQSVSDSINLFGGAPSSKWNEYNWGSFKWGEGTTPTVWSLDHLIGETEALSDAFYKTPEILFDEALALSTDMIELYRRDRAGYYYSYPDRVTNVDSATTASFSQVSVTSTTRTTYTTVTTTWS